MLKNPNSSSYFSSSNFLESKALVSKFKKVQSHQVYVRVTRPALLDLARLLTWKPHWSLFVDC